MYAFLSYQLYHIIPLLQTDKGKEGKKKKNLYVCTGHPPSSIAISSSIRAPDTIPIALYNPLIFLTLRFGLLVYPIPVLLILLFRLTSLFLDFFLALKHKLPSLLDVSVHSVESHINQRLNLFLHFLPYPSWLL